MPTERFDLADSAKISDFLSDIATQQPQNNAIPAFTDIENITDIESITDLIQIIRRHGYVWKEEDNILIADTRKPGHSTIHPYETQIQALRYLKGMLIIDANSNYSLQTINISSIFNKYSDALHTTQAVHQMAEEFSLLLARKLNVSKSAARKQVTMARDLGILLEKHPDICTISQSGKQVTIEVSRHAKISKQYYIDTKLKFKKYANKHAGLTQTWLDKFFNTQPSETWLDKFFDNHFKQLSALPLTPSKPGYQIQSNQHQVNKSYDLTLKGMSAPPSARWLPLPANAQEVEIHTVTRDDANNFTNHTITQFVRMGTTSAYDIKDVNEQKILAKAILKEMVLSRLSDAITNYRNKYASYLDVDPTFFVNYQTLLSPHYLEVLGYPWLLKDNNAAFVEMAKYAMQEVGEKFKEEFKEEYADINLVFCQTNSAVNKQAGWLSIKTFPEDNAAREAMLAAVEKLVFKLEDANDHLLSQSIFGTQSINVTKLDVKLAGIKAKLEERNKNLEPEKKISSEIINEILLRSRAAVHLRLLMNNKPPYNSLSAYQRNIMQASLELLTVGQQGIQLLGCKSARDRTAIVMAAVKTMQENPYAMDNWAMLNAGIISSLKQGHQFRSMSYHVAIVKVQDVHTQLAEQLGGLQKKIKSLKPFVRTLSSISLKSNELVVTSSILPNASTDSTTMPTTTSTENIAKKLVGREREEQAIIHLQNFSKHLWAASKRNQHNIWIGGHRVTYTNKEVKEDVTVPTHVHAMLDDMARANERETSFDLAWRKIARRAVNERHSWRFFRSDETQAFYNNCLKDLGIDPIASIKNLEGIINKKFPTDVKPRHVDLMLKKITEFNALGENIEKESNGYHILNDILELGIKSGDNLWRTRRTQDFYDTIVYCLVLKKQFQNEEREVPVVASMQA